MNRRRLLTEYIRDDADEELDYFTIIPYNEGEAYISRIQAYGYYVKLQDGTEYEGDMWYSLDGGEWTQTFGEYIDVPCFSKIRFKSNWHEMMKDVEVSDDIYVEAYYSASFVSENGGDWWLLEGTPLSLLHGDNFKEQKNDWNYMWDSFFNMFNDSHDVGQINNPKTFLPSTELSEYCYQYMFFNSSICNTPELPAETLKEACYYGMFYNCHYLEEAPVLNAKTLVSYCYSEMFYNCINLRYAKVTATDGFDAENATYYTFYNNAEYGLAVLSQELIDVGFENVFSNWTIISEDYPTNDEGYPEIKGDVTQYDYIICFNADFQERYYDDQTQWYFNYYVSGPNEEGKQLFEDLIEEIGLTVGDGVSIRNSSIFFNRRPITYVYYGVYEDTEYLTFNLSSMYSNPDYVTLFPDGRFDIGVKSDLIHDYIKK